MQEYIYSNSYLSLRLRGKYMTGRTAVRPYGPYLYIVIPAEAGIQSFLISRHHPCLVERRMFNGLPVLPWVRLAGIVVRV